MLRLKIQTLKKVVVVMAFCFCGSVLPSYAQVKDGIQRIYYDSGELKTKIRYENGKKNGIEQHYNRDGTLIKEIYYKDGALMGSVLPEKIRNYGYLQFLKSWKFWTIAFSIIAAAWFLLTKLLLTNKSF